MSVLAQNNLIEHDKTHKMKDINSGGINGLGESLINTNSEDFKALKKLIEKSYQSQSESEKIENGLLSIRFQMESYLNAKIKVEEVKPAGYFIECLLKVVHVTKKHLSEYIGFEYTNLISVMKGRRKINSELAIKLGQIFKIDPAIWLHIESKNELIQEVSKVNRSFSLNELLKRA